MEFFRGAIRKTLEEESPLLVPRGQPWNANGGGGAAAAAGDSEAVSSALSPPNPSLVLANRPPGQISTFTCKKLCAICFVAGVFFGLTLKRRVKRFADKILKYLTD